MDGTKTLGIEAIHTIPRVLGFLNREKTSRTYGCADRYYWHYKLHDYANARFQETSELLALAFLYRRPENPFFGVESIRSWALAAARYWEQLRRSDGTFDEAYPFERSFCATAFSTLHATETFLLLGERPSTDLAPTGRWLDSHDAPDVTNQRAAAAAALQNLGELLGHDAFRRAAKSRADAIVEDAERAGHFNEYGGSDTGYASITLSALAVYARRAKDERVGAWIKAKAGALAAQLDDDGRYRYEGQSRATRFFYPYALAWSGGAGLDKIARGVAEDRILKPSWMDDRYAPPLAADYLRASLIAA